MQFEIISKITGKVIDIYTDNYFKGLEILITLDGIIMLARDGEIQYAADMNLFEVRIKKGTVYTVPSTH